MRTRLKRARKCPICNRPMRKNGHDRNGRQRWQCDACNATTAATVASRSHASTLRAFLDWLLEAAPQRRLDCDARTFRRRSAWCWQLEPRIEPDGVVHRVVMADGTWVNGWCLLAAVDGQNGEVLAWQWCNRESTAAYRALFEQIAPPDVLVCDGMKGILKACAQIWPNTRVQRCLIHMQRDTRADPTSKPRLQAGRELKKLADMLTRIHDAEAAAGWGEAPDAWHERWKRMLAERTYAKDNPDDPRAATSKGGWWWTHLPLRRAYFRLERLFQRDGRSPREFDELRRFRAKYGAAGFIMASCDLWLKDNERPEDSKDFWDDVTIGSADDLNQAEEWMADQIVRFGYAPPNNPYRQDMADHKNSLAKLGLVSKTKRITVEGSDKKQVKRVLIVGDETRFAPYRAAIEKQWREGGVERFVEPDKPVREDTAPVDELPDVLPNLREQMGVDDEEYF